MTDIETAFEWIEEAANHSQFSDETNHDMRLFIRQILLGIKDGERDLRKLAEEIFDDATGEAYDRNPDYLEEDVRPIAVGKIITALQSVQREEREKVEGLRAALEAIERHQRLCMGGTASLSTTWSIANKALAAYEANKDGAA